MAMNSATGFLRTGEHAAAAGIEFHIQPGSADKPGESLNPFPSFATSVCVLLHESRGRVSWSAARSARAAGVGRGSSCLGEE